MYKKPLKAFLILVVAGHLIYGLVFGMPFAINLALYMLDEQISSLYPTVKQFKSDCKNIPKGSGDTYSTVSKLNGYCYVHHKVSDSVGTQAITSSNYATTCMRTDLVQLCKESSCKVDESEGIQLTILQSNQVDGNWRCKLQFVHNSLVSNDVYYLSD